MTSRVRLGTALFFALLVATMTVAVLVVRARSPDLVLEVVRGLPCSLETSRPGPGREAEFEFFVRESDPGARVSMVDSGEEEVRTLDASVALRAFERVSYGWDGRNDDGARVPRGRYRLQVTLPVDDREMVWPRRISVDVPTTAFACGPLAGERS